MSKVKNFGWYYKKLNDSGFIGIIDNEKDFENCDYFLKNIKERDLLNKDNNIDVKNYCKVIRGIWGGDIERYIGYEEKYYYLKEILNYLGKNNWINLMDEEEKIVYDNFDDEIVVYRGINLKDEEREIEEIVELNLSWSIKKEVAEWFSMRFNKGGYKKSILLEGKVKKNDIWFYNKWRDEFEIVSDYVIWEK